MNQRHVPGQTPSCAITVHVTPRVFEGLVSKARAAGMTASVYAGLLFHAGWAARCGKAADDAELTAAVDRVVARLEAVRSRPAPTPPALPAVVHVAAVLPVAPATAAALDTLARAATTVLAEAPPTAPAAPEPLVYAGFSPRESLVLSLVAGDAGASITELLEALATDDGVPTRNIASAMIANVRAKLRKVAPSIVIEAVHGWGWRMSARDRAAVARLERRAA